MRPSILAFLNKPAPAGRARRELPQRLSLAFPQASKLGRRQRRYRRAHRQSRGGQLLGHVVRALH